MCGKVGCTEEQSTSVDTQREREDTHYGKEGGGGGGGVVVVDQPVDTDRESTAVCEGALAYNPH